MSTRRGCTYSLVLGLLTSVISLQSFALPLTGRYALILSEAPTTPAQKDAREAAQTPLRAELARRNIPVTGSVQVLMNAVFVQAPKDRVDELKALPGVKAVLPIRMFRRNLDKAVQLQNIPAAWALLGGTGNAGAGIKIGILDTGIDITHPAFQDPSLSIPAGFPKCLGADCNFTNNKVIVARSYVSILAAGSQPNPAVDSRPDDLSPRDHLGHGTALGSVSAGVTNKGPAATITGVAPKAWLGNYKIFGSPGVNDFTGGDVIVRALEDALNDGMDIAVLSIGGPAFSGALDQGAVCGNPAGVLCDFEAAAVENAIAAGMLVSISAGNSGDSGASTVTYGTIESPGTAPSAVTVGASTNGHVFLQAVRVPGANVPANLQTIAAQFGDGPLPSAPLTAPLKDVSKLDSTGLACSALPAGSLTGSIAMVVRSQCFFSDKVNNSYNAGAVGVVIVQAPGGGAIFPPGGLAGTPIPAAMISDTDGANLKAFLAANPSTQVTLDATLAEFDVTTANQVASFSSRGPSIDGRLKPDMVGVGTDMYMATQHYDSNGIMYDPSGYTVADGTSFSGPTVAGAAALVKQKNPGFTPAQLKSAVVNSATQDVTDNGSVASIAVVGNGKLNGAGAVQVQFTSDPAAISFGVLTRSTGFPAQQALRIHYNGTAPSVLNFAVVPSVNGGNVPTLDKTSLSFAPGGADQIVNVSLPGALPAAGRYEGVITIQGAGVSSRVPYLYMVSDGVPFDVVPMSGFGFDGAVGQQIPDGILAFRFIDQYGVGLQGVPVQFSVPIGGGQLRNASTSSGPYGIVTAEAFLGPNPGAQRFQAVGGGFRIPFDGNARIPPAISAGGVVNAASFQAGAGVVPGSYISIFGSNMADSTAVVDTSILQVSLNSVSVSFDIPSLGISLPAHFIFVSPGQINVQVPWELPSGATVQMKVTIGFVPGALFSTQVVDYSPAVYADTSSFAAALDESFNVITTSNPVQRGHVVQLFVNGLGQVDHRPATGEPAGSNPLSNSIVKPTVTIGGVNAPAQFSGLAPGFAGLNQINVVVPAGINAGNQQVVVTMGAVSSPAVTLPVK